jgi:hypothetical protein
MTTEKNIVTVNDSNLLLLRYVSRLNDQAWECEILDAFQGHFLMGNGGNHTGDCFSSSHDLYVVGRTQISSVSKQVLIFTALLFQFCMTASCLLLFGLSLVAHTNFICRGATFGFLQFDNKISKHMFILQAEYKTLNVFENLSDDFATSCQLEPKLLSHRFILSCFKNSNKWQLLLYQIKHI